MTRVPTALKLCPFCGGPAEIDTQQGYANYVTGRHETAIAVYCLDCTATISICRGDIPDVEPEDVIMTWNNRNRDDLLDALAAGFQAGCEAVQANYRPDPDPEFGEAARDYARAFLNSLGGA